MKPKTPQEIENIRESGRITAEVLKLLAKSAIPGITTEELDDIAMQETERLGAKPAFLGFEGFPKAVCISVNEAVVHGIPDNYVLQNGDVVGLDFGVSYGGMVTDSAITVGVGRVDPQATRLIQITEQSMYAGIDMIKTGARTGDVGAAIEAVIRKAQLGLVRDLAGHGVGHSLHEDPWIPNYGTSGQGSTLKSGMTIAIEPMATLGTDDVILEADGWTVTSADGSLAAHFEHTVLVTDDGFEVLTS
jgi:methionyl aminopeptidase